MRRRTAPQSLTPSRCCALAQVWMCRGALRQQPKRIGCKRPVTALRKTARGGILQHGGLRPPQTRPLRRRRPLTTHGWSRLHSWRRLQQTRQHPRGVAVWHFQRRCGSLTVRSSAEAHAHSSCAPAHNLGHGHALAQPRQAVCQHWGTHMLPPRLVAHGLPPATHMAAARACRRAAAGSPRCAPPCTSRTAAPAPLQSRKRRRSGWRTTRRSCARWWRQT